MSGDWGLGTEEYSSQLTNLSIIVCTPYGETTTEKLTITGSGWSYPLNPSQAGSYRIWVRAVDEVGNIAQTESYKVDVVGLTDQLWLPLIANRDG